MDKGFRVLERIVQAANIRQKVIASNIANVDTPGYKAKDVKFDNLLGREMKLLTSDPKHIGGGDAGVMSAREEVEGNLSWEDKNNVELNAEVANMTENALLHDAAVTIMTTKIKMFKNAISTRGR
ncbi:MAG: flagellar basal body rod protein FlgB [Nitrospiraceae bacterium]|nr:MAG: flagellar basal body rod protein FlgB [Nitrospiraceae bacterium]